MFTPQRSDRFSGCRYTFWGDEGPIPLAHVRNTKDRGHDRRRKGASKMHNDVGLKCARKSQQIRQRCWRGNGAEQTRKHEPRKLPGEQLASLGKASIKLGTRLGRGDTHCNMAKTSSLNGRERLGPGRPHHVMAPCRECASERHHRIHVTNRREAGHEHSHIGIVPDNTNSGSRNGRIQDRTGLGPLG